MLAISRYSVNVCRVSEWGLESKFAGEQIHRMWKQMPREQNWGTKKRNF